jgi:hypothetical protein
MEPSAQQRNIDRIIFTVAVDALSSSIVCFAVVGCCRVVGKITSLFKMVVVALTCLVVFSLCFRCCRRHMIIVLLLLIAVVGIALLFVVAVVVLLSLLGQRSINILCMRNANSLRA